jgi:hypothetical protein
MEPCLKAVDGVLHAASSSSSNSSNNSSSPSKSNSVSQFPDAPTKKTVSEFVSALKNLQEVLAPEDLRGEIEETTSSAVSSTSSSVSSTSSSSSSSKSAKRRKVDESLGLWDGNASTARNNTIDSWCVDVCDVVKQRTKFEDRKGFKVGNGYIL